MTAEQPPAARIATCVDTVTALSQNATNMDDLAKAQEPMATAAARDGEAYHWCFFSLMLKLDSELEQGGASLSTTGPLFYDGMRQLWILARGLDMASGSETYFSYLRKRYRTLSREYFGRSLEVLGPPLKVRSINPPNQIESTGESSGFQRSTNPALPETAPPKPAGAHVEGTDN